MTNVWCVRAEFGKYADQFVKGGYVAVGWLPQQDLSAVTTREELAELYKAAQPDDSKYVAGQQVGQIARFLLEIQPGDIVITPSHETEWLHHGTVEAGDSYQYVASPQDGCPYAQRRRVKWHPKPVRRSEFSVPFQNTIRSSLTVFAISQRDEFLARIGKGELAAPKAPEEYDPYRAVLLQILELDAKEFEILVGHLLTALGFEGTEVTGKSGDGGVDAIGELNISNLAKVKIFVQAKRYQLGSKVKASVVKQLRQAIPSNGQGAFITTADFDKKAPDVALEPGFPRIGLIHGHQLVDLLVEHWADIPTEFRDRLGLKPGLVLA
jgi:predicted Mrr-cat superfamily restriction endonuclease